MSWKSTLASAGRKEKQDEFKSMEVTLLKSLKISSALKLEVRKLKLYKVYSCKYGVFLA